MAVDVSTFGVIYGTDSTAAFQSAVNSGQALIVSGDLRFGSVTVDSPGCSIVKTGNGSLTGTNLNLKRFNFVRSDDSPLVVASQITIPPTASVRNALIKNLSMGTRSLLFDNSGDVVSDALGMVVDGIQWANSGPNYNLTGGVTGWAEGVTVQNCVGNSMGGATVSLCGQNNLIQNNTHNNGSSLIGFHFAPHVRRYQSQPRKPQTGNIIRGNTANNVLEESFSFDVYGDVSCGGVACTGIIAGKTSNTITLTSIYKRSDNLFQGNWVGLAVGFVNGNAVGQYRTIVGQSGLTLTLDGDLSQAAVGDYVSVQVIFANNEFDGNIINGSVQSGIFLFGSSYDNWIHDNVFNSSFSPVRIFSFVNMAGGVPIYTPCARNIVENNTVKSCLNPNNWGTQAFYDIGCNYTSSGREPLPAPYPMLFSVGNIFRNNTVLPGANFPKNFTFVNVRDDVNTGNTVPEAQYPDDLYNATFAAIEAGNALPYTTVVMSLVAEETSSGVLSFSTQPTATAVDSGGTINYGTMDSAADDAVSTASNYVTILDKQILRDAAVAIVSSGASLSSTQIMLEGVLTTAQSAVAVTDTVRSVESVLAQIQAFPTVQDLYQQATRIAAPFLITSQPSVAQSTTDGGVIVYGTADAVADDVVTEASATTRIVEVLQQIEGLVTAIQAIPTVSDVVAQLESVVTTAQVQCSVVDAKITGVGEALVSAALGMASATDVQLMVDNVTIMARSAASLSEIARYLETVASTVMVHAGVSDILRGSFLGQYLRADTCRPRHFADLCAPRTFTDSCSQVSHYYN